MSLRLLDIPSEVLDVCLEELLPPLSEYQRPLGSVRKVPFPVDLCNVVLVCRTLRALGWPLVWRRLGIRFKDTRLRVENSALPNQWEYLRTHPDLSTYVRHLNFDIRLGTLPDQGLRALTLLHDAMKAMVNLRVLNFLGSQNGTQDIVLQVCTELASKPRIHTIVASCFAPPNLPSMTNLRRLNVSALDRVDHLLRVAPCLQCLSIEGAVEDLQSLPIPWHTLREIEFHLVDSWDLVLDNFSSWKSSFPDLSSPLVEILIDDLDPDPEITEEQMDQLLSVFNGQKLQRLSLLGPSYVDSALLDRISKTFPDLQFLGLFMNTAYGEALSCIAQSLGNFAMLRCLHWNYIDAYVDERTVSFIDLKHRFQNTVSVISRRCRALEFVKFYYGGQPAFSYSIPKDKLGRSGEYIEKECNDSRSFFTSGWDLCNF